MKLLHVHRVTPRFSLYFLMCILFSCAKSYSEDSGATILTEQEGRELWESFVVNAFLGNERFFACYEGGCTYTLASGETSTQSLARVCTASISASRMRWFASGTSSSIVNQAMQRFAWEYEMLNGENRAYGGGKYGGVAQEKAFSIWNDPRPLANQYFDIFSAVFFPNLHRFEGKATHDNLDRFKLVWISGNRLKNGDVEVSYNQGPEIIVRLTYGKKSGFQPVRVTWETTSAVFQCSSASWKSCSVRNDQIWIPDQLEFIGISLNGNVNHTQYKLTKCLFGDEVNPQWFSDVPSKWRSHFIDNGNFNGQGRVVEPREVINALRDIRQ